MAGAVSMPADRPEDLVRVILTLQYPYRCNERLKLSSF
jgi:hypothetical protein